MSEEPRESAEEAGTPAVPASPAPPSFGQVTPAEPEGPADAIGFSPFGLEKPWWAAAESEEPDPSVNISRTEEPEDTEPPTPSFDTLVAGVGVPSVDTRRAVPAEPIVQRPSQTFSDTDPDGIPVIGQDTLTPPPATSAGQPTDTDVAASTATTDHTNETTHTGQPADTGAAAAMGAAPNAGEPPNAGVPASADEAASAARPDHADEAASPRDAASMSEAADAGDVSGAAAAAAGVGGADASGPGDVGQGGDGTRADDVGGRVEAGEPQFMAAPVLLPDAILPPGITPPTDSSVVPVEPEAEPEEQAEPTIITPVYHAEGGLSIDAAREEGPSEQALLGFGPPGEKPGGQPSGGNRKALLIVGAVAAALVATAATFAVISGTSGDGKPKAASPSPSRADVKPSPAAPPAPPPVDISSEKTDPRPLALAEAYPSGAVDLGGRAYIRDRSSVNHRCSLAARGAMADALTRQGCRSVVRVTYLDRGKALAVTTGIAAMPDRSAALRASKAGSPSQYEWFRGMAGRRSQSIDQAGGYAVSTVRGRYIIYAYAQYANGRRAQPDDQTLKTAAQQFVDYSVRPIDARAT